MPNPSPAPVLTIRATPHGISTLAQQDMSVKITFTQGSALGQQTTINGVTYAVYSGTWSFDPVQVTMNQGNKGTITLSLDPSSTSGWELYEFFVKNPAPNSGLDEVAYAGTNKKIAVTDNNLIVGTYNYGVMVLNSTQRWCASYDPTIFDQGGGQDLG